eukprot:7637080-Karenia_brevis.AAC.1
MPPRPFGSAVDNDEPRHDTSLKITRRQHANFGKTCEIKETPTLSKVFPENDSSVQEMNLQEWWSKMWPLKKGASGWLNTAAKMGIEDSKIQRVDGKEE